MNAFPRKAAAVAALAIACVTGWLSLEAPRGTLADTDELLTAERSREMLLLGRSEVHFNFQPSFEKPPLQYWLTSVTLPRFKNRTLAVRIWPLIYGALTLIALAWLAFLIDSTRPWLVPLSVALLASCPLFSAEMSRGLLDLGLTFFTTLAILFAHLARKRPVLWLAVAMVSWLGCLQKIPLILLVWALILIVRLSSTTERPSVRSGWVILSIIGALLAVSVWPAIQLVKYQMPLGSVFHEEVVVWLGPQYLGTRPYLEIPRRLIVVSVCGLFLLLAPFVVLVWRTQRFSGAVKEISIVCLGLIGLAVVSNFRSVRYIVPIIPALCLILAIVLHRLLEQKRAIRIGTIAFLIVLLTAGFVQTKIQIDSRRKDVANEKRVAEELGALQREGTRTVLIREVATGTDLLFDSFYLFHGNLRFPVAKYKTGEIRQSPPSPPLVGVCIARDLPVVQEVYPNVRVQFTRAQFILWRVD